MHPGRPHWWLAEYMVGDTPLLIKGVSTNECPVSLITPESRGYLETYERSLVMKDAGVLLYGPALAEWPIWAVDVITVLEMERRRTDSILSSPHAPNPDRC